MPLCVDHFRYYAGCMRAQEGTMGEIDETTVSYQFHEPLGVVGQIIPWNFPLLMAAWKLAPALVTGNCIVMKPAEQTPVSILKLMEVIGDLLPPGVLNIVNGFGREAGEALATSTRIAKIAFTGSTPVGQHILKCAADNLIPSTVELGGKSPNIFFEDIMQQEDDYISKAAEGAVLAFFNQGEVCTCPSRALIQESIYDEFISIVIERSKKIIRGNPLDTDTQVGAQASQQQFEKILDYVEIGKQEGAELLIGGNVAQVGSEFNAGYYIEPTLFKGTNNMRIFQEEIFGPVVSVTTFKDEAEALAIANDTEFGLGAGLWTRDTNLAYRMGRGIQAGRVWTNCYHLYPAHAAFGGYKKSGIGRETHKMMLDHYQQTKNLLVSYSTSPLGFF
jgi:aldehyde dehydrogenase